MVQSQLLSSTIVVVIVLAVRRKYLYINIVICDLHLLDIRLIFSFDAGRGVSVMMCRSFMFLFCSATECNLNFLGRWCFLCASKEQTVFCIFITRVNDIVTCF